MKKLIHLFAFILFLEQAQSQCEPFSNALVAIIVKQEFSKINDLALPNHALLDLMNWTQSEESLKKIQPFRDTAITEIIQSVKTLRNEFVVAGFNLTEIKVVKCIQKHRELKIYVSDKKRNHAFRVNVLTADKTYLLSPINKTLKNPFQALHSEEPANRLILMNGEIFQTFKPNREQEEKGLLILKKCLPQNFENANIFLEDGIIDKNKISLLLYLVIKNNEITKYKVTLNSEACELIH